MCIAIYSPMGNDIPQEQYLKNSFIGNDDGAGFAFNTDDGRVKICKGFMTYDNFIDAFNRYNNKYNFKDRGVLIHFRITTHGGTCKECCHPFPLLADEGAMHKLEYTSDYAVIHNGIIDLTSIEAHKRKKMSDTMVFIEKYLTKIATNKNWFENDNNFELIYDLIDSKMAILNGDGRIKSTYGFTKDEDGNYYSNQTYKTPRYTYYSSGWYDDYDNWGYPGQEYYSGAYISSNASYIYSPAWMIRKGEFVYMDDGECIDYDSTLPIYVTVDGDVFISTTRNADTSKFIVEDVDFYGCGAIYNSATFAEISRPTDKSIKEKNYLKDFDFEEKAEDVKK